MIKYLQIQLNSAYLDVYRKSEVPHDFKSTLEEIHKTWIELGLNLEKLWQIAVYFFEQMEEAVFAVEHGMQNRARIAWTIIGTELARWGSGIIWHVFWLLAGSGVIGRHGPWVIEPVLSRLQWKYHRDTELAYNTCPRYVRVLLIYSIWNKWAYRRYFMTSIFTDILKKYLPTSK